LTRVPAEPHGRAGGVIVRILLYQLLSHEVVPCSTTHKLSVAFEPP
jgi:hypothetical protein